MKSFFKKLAFVMALAMVVTMAAPAASAVAANELVLAFQDAASKAEAITEFNLKAGDAQDLKFYGAPSNYKSLDPTWTSSDTNVATVDTNGNVTAVAAGTATITFTLNNGMSGAAVVTVPADETPVPVVTGDFKVKQTSVNAVQLIFDVPATNVNVDTLEVIWLLSDIEVSLTAKNVTVENNVATVVMNDNFTDGNSYIFRYDGKDVKFTASAGELARVGFSWYTDDEVEGAGKAYVTTDDEIATTVLVPHFYDEKGVDITSKYDVEGDFEIVYTLTTESESYDLVDNELTFNAISQAVINMAVTWTDDEGEPHTLYGVNGIVGVKRPAVELTVVKGGFMKEDAYPTDRDNGIDCLTDFTTNPDSTLWKNNKYTNEWVLGDEIDSEGNYATLQAAAIVKDNRGNTVVTGIEMGEDEGQYPYGYFTFASSKETILGVGESGDMSLYEPGKANILVYFVPADAEDEEAERVLIGAIKVTVKDERYPVTYKMIADMSNCPVAPINTNVKDADGNVIYEANEIGKTADAVLQVYDQYGAPYEIDPSAITVEASSKTNEVEAEVGKACTCYTGTHYHITAPADEFVSQVKSSSSKSFKYTVTVDKETYEKITTKSDSFTYKMTNVAKYYNQLVEVLPVIDANNTEASEKAMKLETFYYSGVKNSTNTIDLAVKEVIDWTHYGADGTPKGADIWLNYLSSSNGLELLSVPAANIQPLAPDQTTGLAGVVYYKETTASQKLTEDVDGMSITVNDGNIHLTFNNSTTTVEEDGYAGYFKFGPTGTYKLTLYTAKENGAKLSAKTHTYTVKNTNSQVVFAGFNAELGNETEVDIVASEKNPETGKYELRMSESDVLAIIEENLVFTLEGMVLDLSEDAEIDLVDILAFEVGTVNDKAITIKNVTFAVRLDDASGDQYICSKVRVNKTIREK